MEDTGQLQKLELLKENIKKIGKNMLLNCDIYHQKLYEKQFIPCFNNKCLSLFNNLKDENQVQNFTLESDNNFETMLVHKDKVEEANKYNDCVKNCQEDLR